MVEWRGSNSLHRVSLREFAASVGLAVAARRRRPHQHLSTIRSIAFKPAESGWGGSNKYGSNFDRIFGKKDSTSDKSTSEETTKKDSEKTPKGQS